MCVCVCVSVAYISIYVCFVPCGSACVPHLHITISFPLSCNKSSHMYYLTVEWFETTRIYYLTVSGGSGIWTQLIWVIHLGSHKATINGLARAVVSSEAQLQRNLVWLANQYFAVVGRGFQLLASCRPEVAINSLQ